MKNDRPPPFPPNPRITQLRREFIAMRGSELTQEELASRVPPDPYATPTQRQMRGQTISRLETGQMEFTRRYAMRLAEGFRAWDLPIDERELWPIDWIADIGFEDATELTNDAVPGVLRSLVENHGWSAYRVVSDAVEDRNIRPRLPGKPYDEKIYTDVFCINTSDGAIKARKTGDILLVSLENSETGRRTENALRVFHAPNSLVTARRRRRLIHRIEGDGVLTVIKGVVV